MGDGVGLSISGKSTHTSQKNIHIASPLVWRGKSAGQSLHPRVQALIDSGTSTYASSIC